jgi:hypothetical protein
MQVLQVTNGTEKTMIIRMRMIAQNALVAFVFRCYFREMMIKFVQQHYPQTLSLIRAWRGLIAGKNSR